MSEPDPLLPRRFGIHTAISFASVIAVGVGMTWVVMRDDTPLIDFGGEQAVFEDLDELRASLPPAEGVPLAEGEIPQLARNFDPEMAGRHAGILGMVEQESGHFLASPYGSAFAVGEDNQDVWGGLTGSEIGESYGVGGLGLVGTGRGGGGSGEGTIGLGSIGVIGSGSGSGRADRRSRGWRGKVDLSAEIDVRADNEGYQGVAEHEFMATRDDDRSTFSIDVDTASYSNVRRILGEGRLPPAAAVRIEELINYFDYSDEPPTGDAPFSVHSEVATCPWAEDHLLVRVGLQGQMFNAEDLPTRNFVFLVDVSGSMEDRLPLLRQSLELLVDDLRPQDRVGIVVYAGASGVVLDPTKGDAKDEIRKALAKLQSGGSTNGGAGIELAYRLAERHFVEGGANRVILATDGDFNVGVSSHRALEQLIERKRESGVFLSVLGFGSGNVQDSTMELLADKGNGNYAYIDSIDEAKKVLVTEAAATLVTIAKDVKIQVELDADEVASWRLVGYENRKLAHEDFEDDRKDAGEIGAGHDVTALYEIVPKHAEHARTGKLMRVALRYKAPDGNESTPLFHDVSADARSLASSSDDLRFAAAVAQLGMLLRESKHRGNASWASTLALATAARGDDPTCARAEMVGLIARAAELSGVKGAGQHKLACKA